MDISFIIPVFNSSRTIHRCVDSLLSIENITIEIILVDDCSTDNSYEILIEYQTKYPDIVIVEQLVQKGRQGGARNSGITLSRGNHIMFIDSDDWIDSLSLEDIYIEIDKSMDLVISNTFKKDNGNKENDWHIKLREGFYRSIADEDKKNFIINPSPVWNIIYKRDFLVRNSIKFPSNLAFEDNYWHIIIMSFVTNIQVLSISFYHYYYNTESTTKTKNSIHQLDKIVIASLIYDFYNSNEKLSKFREECQYWYIYNIIWGGVNATMHLFRPPNLRAAYTVRKIVKNTVPDFHRNKYFIESFDKYDKQRLQLFIKSPILYIIYILFVKICRK